MSVARVFHAPATIEHISGRVLEGLHVTRQCRYVKAPFVKEPDETDNNVAGVCRHAEL